MRPSLRPFGLDVEAMGETSQDQRRLARNSLFLRTHPHDAPLPASRGSTAGMEICTDESPRECISH